MCPNCHHAVHSGRCFNAKEVAPGRWSLCPCKPKEEADDPSPNRGVAGDPDPASPVVASTLGASVYEAMFPTMYGGQR